MKHDWEIKRLDEIIESNIIGLTKNSSEQDIHHEFKYVKMNNITRDNCFDLSKYTCVNAEKEEVEKYSLFNGDFLFNTRNSYELVGKTCLFEGYNNEVILYNNNIMRIRFLKNINPFFINYAFSTDDLIKKLDRLKSGTTNVSAIYYKDLKNLELLIPPLPAQQRIVAILDEVFAAIAKAKANAEQNLKNSKELFESYLQGVFENKGEGWDNRRLGESDLIEIIDGDRGKNYPTLKDFKDEGFCLFMNTKNVRPDGFLFNTTMFIDEAKDKAMGKGKLKRNDVVMTTRGTIGNLGVYNEEVEFDNIRINSGMLIFRPNLKQITSEYLFEILRSGIIKEQIRKQVTGAAQPQLPIKTLVNFIFPVPKSLKQQQTIVQKLDALSLETKRLEAIYQQKINDLEELKKSVLQKAFSGELKEKT